MLSAPRRQLGSVWPLVLSSLLAGIAAACGGDSVDMGQVPGAGGKAGGGGLALGGKSSGGTNAAGTSSVIDNPCGSTPCADHTGDKVFVEDGAPADAADTFDGATVHETGSDAQREPAIIYPSHETMFPINVSHIRHDWSASSNDLFELRFVGPNTTVTVYTASLTWTPSDEQWDWIAESNRGKSVELTVSGPRTVRNRTAAASGVVWSSSSRSASRSGVRPSRGTLGTACSQKSRSFSSMPMR